MVRLSLRMHMWWQRYDVWLLTLLAFAVRLVSAAHIDYTNFPEFYRDYAMTSRIVAGDVVWLGPPSMLGGFHFPSFYYYTMAPFLWLSGGHPASLIVTGALLGALSVFAFYKLLLLWTGRVNAARLGALLLALSVYSLHLSSYTSNPNFLPIFVLGFFYYLTLALGRSATNRDYLLLGLLFAAATQLHTTALIVLPLVSLLGSFLLGVVPPLKKLLLSFAVVILCYIPYLGYDAAHGFANLRRLFVLGVDNLHGGNVGFSVQSLWNFFAGTLTPFNYWYGFANIEPNSLYSIVAAAFAPVLCVALWKVFSGRLQGVSKTEPLFTSAGRVIAWLWFSVVAVVLLLYSRAAHDHYLIVLWPLPLVLLTWFVFQVKSRLGVYRAFVFALVVVSVLQIVSFHRRANVSWVQFFETYNSVYKNNPNISEIGAVW